MKNPLQLRLFCALGVLLSGGPAGVQGQFGLTPLEEDFTALGADASLIVGLDRDGTLSTSTDGGRSFTPRVVAGDVVSDPSAKFESVAVRGMTAVAVGVDGLIVRTGTGGQSWEPAQAPVLLGSLYDVAARGSANSAGTWVAVGDAGFDAAIYRSTDGGLSWSAQSAPSGGLLRGVVWAGSRWVAVGSDSLGMQGRVYTSSDGGSWTASTLPGAGTLPLLDVASDGSGVVIAVGEGGEVLRSEDGGLSFSRIVPALRGGVDLTAITAEAAGSFVFGGGESLLVRINGTEAVELVPATAGAPQVRALASTGEKTLVAGPAKGQSSRSGGLEVELSPGGSLGLVITVTGTLEGRIYFVQSTEDPAAGEWSNAADKQQVDTGHPVRFEVAPGDGHLFWRVLEF